MKDTLILAIESSCDETAAAIIKNGREIVSNVVLTQIERHKIFGGVVPEIASRLHIESISQTVDKAFADAGISKYDIDAIAVTAAPGLIGSLLVGVNYAKSLAFLLNKPLVPVHHLRGHVAANYLAHKDLEPPFLCLIASGGHSHIVAVQAKPLTRRQGLWAIPIPAALLLINPPHSETRMHIGFPVPILTRLMITAFQGLKRRFLTHSTTPL